MSIQTISVENLKHLLENKQVVLIDVREPAEYEAGHIQNAVLIPLGEIANSKLPECEGKKLVLQCKLGKRSYMACEQLVAVHPGIEVHNLEGGIQAWIDAGYPVESC